MIKKYIRLIICLVFIIDVFSGITIANPSEFVAGEHFKTLRTFGATKKNLGNVPYEILNAKSKHKPQIMMFFSYGCHGCWKINKYFTDWCIANKNNIEVLWVPVAYNNVWEGLAKLYYVNKELGFTEDHEEIFARVNRDYKKLWLESEVLNFYAKKNIAQDQVLKIYNSFDVARKIKKAIDVANFYEVHLTPNIILHVQKNSYMINFTMVQNVEDLFKVIDYLIKVNPG